MGLSLGRRSDTARCAGCQRRGETLTLLGNGTSYCPSCAERVRKLLGFGPDVDDEILEPDELTDGEPIVALGFEPADETPGEQIAEPELAEGWSAAASAEDRETADEAAHEAVTESQSPVLTGPWAVPALDASDAEDDSPEQAPDLDAATPPETVAEHPWQHDEEPQWATDAGSPLVGVGDEPAEHAHIEHEVVAQAPAPTERAVSSEWSRLGPVDPIGDPAAGTFAARGDDDEAGDEPPSYTPQESKAGYQLDHEQDEPKESAMVAMESDEDAYEAGDEPASADGGGLGSALHEEHRRLVARRADVERRIEEAASEIEAITRRVELVEALLAEESTAA